jgi:hypothetical protein
VYEADSVTTGRGVALGRDAHHAPAEPAPPRGLTLHPAAANGLSTPAGAGGALTREHLSVAHSGR